ncbi:WecB/TagA/CpsF family glycosyltransferase [Cyanobacteria bacterium FACHB-63]|nr:WecB/TagA/CpsF family glycosyltransferase [Cyanobacteria bacterium FACHB-63]
MDTSLKETLPFIEVVDVRVTALGFEAQIALMMQWAKQQKSRGVCVANVHMLVEAHREPAFADILKKADLVTPDGMPLVWMLRWLGQPRQDRVAGLDIILALCSRAIEEDVRIFLLGSTPEILGRMKARFESEFPNLKIAGAAPLPFRPCTEAEDNAIAQMINESGAGLVMVSLGCPKQEAWIARQKGKVQAVMIGLGGAFPVYAGLKKRTPRLIQNAGLEWLYRLIQEPKRLWWRYASTIPIFIFLAVKQLVVSKVYQGSLIKQTEQS